MTRKLLLVKLEWNHQGFKLKIQRVGMKNKEGSQNSQNKRTLCELFLFVSYGLIAFSVVVGLGGIILDLHFIYPEIYFFIAFILLVFVLTVKIWNFKDQKPTI
jgi:hypothetical protein